ncbi:hypothetical protein E2562_002702 [Oryza meyeriana var. granulata]|uniref:Uncharacterized protein n=1 Tax=Oryza meyeriana var. granulata TaxID=110450 RepID=A0A6G1BQP8_9ORYZ|nr:hypothetical protein E2562_002702 [Oryza meyeriana var. granulata]
MDRGEPSLKPEWLVRGHGTVAATSLWTGTSSPRADDQGRSISSRNQSSGRDRERSSQQSISRRSSGPIGPRRHDRDGTTKSRGYASFGRSNRDRGCEKDSDSRNWESRLGPPEDPLYDGFKPFSSCRPERDRLNHTRLKVDTLNQALGESLDNGVRSVSRKVTGGISFEREFPHLGFEDKNGKQDVGRVPSPGISTPIQSIPLGTAPDGRNSVLAEVPILSGPASCPVSSSLLRTGSSKQMEAPNCGTALSMAETVMQAPLKISTTPQLSIDTHKIEERTMKQCILRPRTPSSNKISVSSSSDKLKPKGARAGDSNGPVKGALQLPIQLSGSFIRAPVKHEPVKPSQSGSFQVLSREQNGIVNTAKDSTSNPASPVLGRSSSVEPLRKPIFNQKLKGVANGLPLQLQGSFGERKSSAKDKHKFFELLRSKSLNGSCTSTVSSSALLDEQHNSCLELFNSGVKCLEHGNSSCEEANSCEGSQQHLSDNEEINPPWEPHDVFDEGMQDIMSGNRDFNSSSEIADTEDVYMKPHTNNAGSTPSVIPAEIDDGSMGSNCSDDEAIVLFESIGTGEEESYPAQDRPSPEEMAFLVSLGWKEDEIVPPLKQEEIADCLRHNVRLQQKLEECRG